MIYKEFSEFVLRTPTFPFNFLEEGLVDLNSLGDKISNTNFKNTLYFGSPLLYNELSKSIDNKISNKKRSTKTINSVLKYLARASTRCTPYGLFSGCSIGQIGAKTRLELDSFSKLNVRLDMEVLCQLHDFIIGDPKLAKYLKFYINPSLYKSGKNLRYIENSDIQKGLYTISQIDSSRLLNKVLKACKNGTAYDDIKSLLLKDGYEYEDCLDYINDLIANQIIIDELYYPTVGEGYLQKILKCFSHTHPNPFIDFLHKVHFEIESLKEFDEDFIEKYSSITSLIESFQKEQKSTIQIDLYKEVINAELGQDILKELKQLLGFLNKFIPHKKDQSIDDFARKFYQRFDEQEVPLVLALDPDIGINYPVTFSQGYKSTLLEGIVKKEEKPTENNFNDFLVAKILDNDRISNFYIELTDSLVNQKEEVWDEFSNTMLAMFSLVKDNDGKKYIYFKGFLGDSAANLLGRFTSGSERISNLVKKITAVEQELEPNSILAEIVHIPEARTGNIMYRQHIREYEILSNGFTDIDLDKRIDIKDIMVSFKRGKLILRSNKINKNIIPKLTTAHNYHSSRSPIYRFLSDYSKSESRSIPSISNLIQVSEISPFMPRIIYKNVILSPAKWFISTLEIKKILDQDQKNLVLEITKWRSICSIPNKVYIEYDGAEMFIDFEKELSIRSITSILNNKDFIVLHEFFYPDDLCKSEQGVHLNEILLPFYKSYETN